MSSLARKIARGRFKPGYTREPAERKFEMLPDGGYRVLHPTKGWRAFTARRVQAKQITDLKRAGAQPWWLGVAAFEQGAAA